MAVEFVPFLDLLSDIVDNRGRTCPTSESGVPLIATNCIRNDLLYPAYDKVRYVSLRTYETWFRGHPRPGDLIFVTKGTPGRVCMAPDPVDFCIAQDMVAVRADPDRIHPRYLFAALRSPEVQAEIERMHVGTLIPHFKKGDFDKLLLPLPDEASQAFIGDVYFLISSKIELNRHMSRTLEDIAGAIFKSWFVDFDPVRAKAAGRQPPGLAPHIADLFPDSFEESDVGEIPKGWTVRPIGDVVQVLGGGTPSTKEPAYWEGGIHPFCTPKDMSSLESPVLLETERHLTDDGVAKVSSGQLPVGTVLLSSRAPIGYLAVTETGVSVNQGIIAMVCDQELPNLYTLFWTEANMERIIARANGSTFLEISKRNFRPIPALVPSRPILHHFSSITEPVYRRIVANVREARILADVRDTLLPKLISGELPVPDAERIVERCL